MVCNHIAKKISILNMSIVNLSVVSSSFMSEADADRSSNRVMEQIGRETDRNN